MSREMIIAAAIFAAALVAAYAMRSRSGDVAPDVAPSGGPVVGSVQLTPPKAGALSSDWSPDDYSEQLALSAVTTGLSLVVKAI